MSLRLKIALVGLAGVGVAWLIPKGGETPPPPTASATPTSRPGITSAEFPLSSIPEGVSSRTADGIRFCLVRSGDIVQAFRDGKGVRVLVAAGRVTIFPQSNIPGASPTAGASGCAT